VVIIGLTAASVRAGAAWDHVAGLSVGQDISERILQLAAAPPQFSLGKSYPGFGPVGPCLVTPDEFANPDDLELGCSINGVQMQKARTRELIFGVPDLIEQLSRVTPLLPGDVIFTGTPSGVGLGRHPQRWLARGDVLTSYIEGIGEMSHRFVAPAETPAEL
jgi:2,4-diketo-3-deoxy-L-fuconate hydrolase